VIRRHNYLINANRTRPNAPTKYSSALLAHGALRGWCAVTLVVDINRGVRYHRLRERTCHPSFFAKLKTSIVTFIYGRFEPSHKLAPSVEIQTTANTGDDK